MKSRTSSSDLLPYSDFEEAALDILETLHQRVGLGLWMVTRKEGEDWIVLVARASSYQVKRGEVFRWSDSFCSRMVRGLGPRIAPCAKDVEVYHTSPIAQKLTIGAYVGMPLIRPSGEIFGTLCAIDPLPLESIDETQEEFISTQARVLSTLIQNEIARVDLNRRLERLQITADSDELTGLQNRRGWTNSLKVEAARAQRFGSCSAVLVIDLDNLKRTNDSYGHAAGDRLICAAGDAIRESVRDLDLVARTGGDEFAVFLVESNPETANAILRRISARLRADSIPASLGLAYCVPYSDISRASAEADRRMYLEKRAKKETTALKAVRVRMTSHLAEEQDP